jgi:hypothetical protein
MARIYIANGQLGTILIRDALPPHLTLGQFKELGPSVDNAAPPRLLATDKLRSLREYPFLYTAEDCAFLDTAPLGCWEKVWTELGARWEMSDAQ